MVSRAAILTPDQIGLLLKILSDGHNRLGIMLESLEEQALAIAKSGNDIPHWIAEHSKGRERWQVGANEVLALGKLLDIDLQKAPECITPSQARKAGLPEEIIKSVAHRPLGNMKLVPFDAAKFSKYFT